MMNTPSSDYIKCEYCNTEIRPRGLYKHHQSNTCQAAQTRKSIPLGWEPLQYPFKIIVRSLQTLGGEPYSTSTKQIPCIRSFQTSYQRPGWGHRGHFNSRDYIDSRLSVIIRCKVLTDTEKIACMNAQPDDSAFQAAYVTATLAGGSQHDD